MLEHTSSEINQLDAGPGLILEQNVFGFDVRMDDIVLPQKHEGIEDLDGEGTNMRHFDRLELIKLHQLVKTDAEQLSYDANMFTKNNEIPNANDVFLVVDILLFGSHQDVDLVQGQLHVLFFRFYYLYGHCLFVLVVEGFHHLPECATTQTLQKLIPITHLLMFSPKI